MRKLKAYMLTRPDPEYVSLVDHGANEAQGGVRLRNFKSRPGRGAATPAGAVPPTEDVASPEQREKVARQLRGQMGIIGTMLRALTGRNAAAPVDPTDEHYVQSLAFDRKRFDRAAATKWAADREFAVGDVEETETTVVLRQFAIAADAVATTRQLDEGVVAVLVPDAPAEKVSVPAEVTKAGTDYDAAVSEYKLSKATPELFDLLYVYQNVLCNICYSDDLADKAAAIQGATAAFTADLNRLAEGLPGMPAEKLARMQLAAKRALRITVIEDADLRTAVGVLSELFDAGDATSLPQEVPVNKIALLKEIGVETRKAFPQGSDGANGSGILSRTVTIDQLLNAFENGTSITDLIRSLESQEQVAAAAGAKPADPAAGDPAAAEPAKPAEKAAVEKTADERLAEIVGAVLDTKLEPVRAEIGELKARVSRAEKAAVGQGDEDAGRDAAEPEKPKGKWAGVLGVGRRGAA
jgi:hypothetical protein